MLIRSSYYVRGGCPNLRSTFAHMGETGILIYINQKNFRVTSPSYLAIISPTIKSAALPLFHLLLLVSLPLGSLPFGSLLLSLLPLPSQTSRSSLFVFYVIDNEFQIYSRCSRCTKVMLLITSPSAGDSPYFWLKSTLMQDYTQGLEIIKHADITSRFYLP